MNKINIRRTGFSLIELVVAIVVLGIGSAAFIGIVNTTKQSVSPQIQQQGNAIARAYLEEIMLNQFCDPNWDPNLDLDGDPLTNPQNCSTDCSASVCSVCKTTGTGWTTEARSTYDDVCDYNGLNDVGAEDQLGNPIGNLGVYEVDVTVTDVGVMLNGLNGNLGQVVLIDVDVTHTTGSTMSLSSYKTNF